MLILGEVITRNKMKLEEVIAPPPQIKCSNQHSKITLNNSLIGEKQQQRHCFPNLLKLISNVNL